MEAVEIEYGIWENCEQLTGTGGSKDRNDTDQLSNSERWFVNLLDMEGHGMKEYSEDEL